MKIADEVVVELFVELLMELLSESRRRKAENVLLSAQNFTPPLFSFGVACLKLELKSVNVRTCLGAYGP